MRAPLAAPRGVARCASGAVRGAQALLAYFEDQQRILPKSDAVVPQLVEPQGVATADEQQMPFVENFHRLVRAWKQTALVAPVIGFLQRIVENERELRGGVVRCT